MTRNEITFKVVKGDITRLKVDAIVNITDTEYSGIAGVDKAVHDAAGPTLKETLGRADNINTSEVVITKGYNLPAKTIIHTIGPVYINGTQGENVLLEAAYTNCLRIADENNIKQVAFSAISTGYHKYPIKEATDIAMRTVIKYVSRGTHVREIIFVCYDDKIYNLYLKKLKNIQF